MDYINHDGTIRSDVFVGKLGTSQDYSWLWEGQAGLENWTDETIHGHVQMHANIVYGMYAAECDEIGVKPMSFQDFLAQSDYSEAIAALTDEIDSQKAATLLDEIDPTINDLLSALNDPAFIAGLSYADQRDAKSRINEVASTVWLRHNELHGKTHRDSWCHGTRFVGKDNEGGWTWYPGDVETFIGTPDDQRNLNLLKKLGERLEYKRRSIWYGA